MHAKVAQFTWLMDQVENLFSSGCQRAFAFPHSTLGVCPVFNELEKPINVESRRVFDKNPVPIVLSFIFAPRHWWHPLASAHVVGCSKKGIRDNSHTHNIFFPCPQPCPMRIHSSPNRNMDRETHFFLLLLLAALLSHHEWFSCFFSCVGEVFCASSVLWLLCLVLSFSPPLVLSHKHSQTVELICFNF